jgi:DNA-directed RNA polymerase II subunit RPB1
MELKHALKTKLSNMKVHQNRTKYLLSLSKTITTCFHCDHPLQKFVFKKKDGFILFKSSPGFPKVQIPPAQVKEVFAKISQEDASLMGVVRPENMIITSLIVPPPVLRPQVMMENGSRAEEPLTFKLSDIIRANNAFASDPSEKNFLALQYFVASFIDSDTACPNAIKLAVRKNSQGLVQKIGTKNGFVRGLIMGSRCDFSARTVVESDPNLKVNQVGVPQQILFSMFFTETATKYNIEWLQTLVDRGPSHPQGARHIFKFPVFQEVDLKRCPKGRPERRVQLGDRVERYYQNGDYCHVNRQPTLHGPGIQGHEIVAHNDKVVRINTAVCTAFNADFDGDEVNLHFPQSIEAHAEVRDLMNTTQHVINITNNNPIIYPIQDTILGAHMLINDNNLSVEHVSDMCMASDVWPKSPITTGKQLFSLLLPPNLSGTFGNLIVQNGNILEGVINKSNLSAGHGSLVHRICLIHGPEKALTFIYQAQKLAAAYLRCKAFSIGPEAIDLPSSIRENVNEVYSLVKQDIDDMLTSCHQGTLPQLPGIDKAGSLELLSTKALNRCINAVASKVQNIIPETNTILSVVKAKSKGSEVNLIQSGCALFQQNIRGHRPSQGWQGRVLTHHPKFSNDPQHRGMVVNSFSSGLTGPEYFMAGFGGRGGLIDTACNTAQTGYAQRRLTKGLEGVNISSDLTVRNDHGNVIMFNYGGNSFHPAKESKQSLWVVKDSIHSAGNRLENIPVFTEGACADIDTEDFITNVVQQKDEPYFLGKGRTWFMSKAWPVSDIVLSAVNIPWMLDSGIISRHGPQDTFESNNQRRKQFVLKSRQYVPSLMGLASPVFELLILQNTNWVIMQHYNLEQFWTEIWEQFKLALAVPGSTCGLWAALALGEPSTQLTLNTFHSSGLASGQNSGISRFNEIINCGKSINCPLTHVFLDGTVPSFQMRSILPYTSLHTIGVSEKFLGLPEVDLQWIEMWKLINEPFASDSVTFCVRVKIATRSLKPHFDSVDNMVPILKESTGAQILAIDEHPSERGNAVLVVIPKAGTVTDWISFSKFEHTLMETCISGVKGVGSVIAEKIPKPIFDHDAGFHTAEETMLIAEGSNIVDILSMQGVDRTRTFTNDVHEVAKVLGIEAARTAIEREIMEVLESHQLFVNPKHIRLVPSMMCHTGNLVPLTRFGINRGENSTLLKASFEESVEMVSEAACHGVANDVKCIADCIYFGKLCPVGTGITKIDVNSEQLLNYFDNEEHQSTDIPSPMYQEPEDEFVFKPPEISNVIPPEVLKYLQGTA